jgi:hypothetical protein
MAREGRKPTVGNANKRPTQKTEKMQRKESTRASNGRWVRQIETQAIFLQPNWKSMLRDEVCFNVALHQLPNTSETNRRRRAIF